MNQQQVAIIAKNQQGEQSNLTVFGGSSLFCNFVTDLANGNGLGLRSLKGSGNADGTLQVKNVYTHTSATPAAGNPNPAAGIFLVEFAKAYKGYITGNAGFVSPVTGTPVTSPTAGVLYVIVALGTATASQWQARGLPVGVTPAIGATFIATGSGALPGSAAVEAIATAGSNVDHCEIAGDPNTTLNVTGGGYLYVQAFKGNALTAPADGTVVGLTFNLIQAPGPQI